MRIGDWSWYVFNVADAAIVAGVVGLLYDPSCWSGAGWPEQAAGFETRLMFALIRRAGVSAQNGNINKVDAMRGLKVFGCAERSALMVAATGASAQEGEVVKSLLGSIGIIPKEKPPINYSERAAPRSAAQDGIARARASAQRREPVPTGRRIRTSSLPARPRPMPERRPPARKSIAPTASACSRSRKCAPAAIPTTTSSRRRP